MRGSSDATMPAELRLQRIQQQLEQRGFVRVRELAEELGVSTVTARADLQTLEERQCAYRVHGGAMPLSGRGERTFEEVATQRADEKRAVAAAAATLVSSGETVILDVGTSAAALATELVARPDLDELTIVTSGLKIALALEAAHPRFTVVVSGGTLRPKQHSLVDPLATEMLQMLSVDTAFLGCNGVSVEYGVTNLNLPEASVKRAMLGAARRTVVLADSSKLGARALAPVCTLDDVDVLVTDDGADESKIEQLKAAGVDVVVA